MRDRRLKRLVLLSMFVALGVVISPLLRVEGLCPMQHLVNVIVSVLLGPWYSLACATAIGCLRMTLMGIPPLALTGAVFGAFLSGYLYRLSGDRLLWAPVGEIIGTGIIGSLASYPVMKFLVGYGGIGLFYYTPSFLAATTMGGGSAYLLLKALEHRNILAVVKKNLQDDDHR